MEAFELRVENRTKRKKGFLYNKNFLLNANLSCDDSNYDDKNFQTDSFVNDYATPSKFNIFV